MNGQARSVSDAIGVVSQLLEAKVRRSRVCGCQPCKNEAQGYVDWVAAPPTPAPPQRQFPREAWWR